MGSRALYFYLPVLNLPTGTTHVFIMKNKLYLCVIRESCPTGQQVCFACRRGWQYSVSTEPSQRSGKAVLVWETASSAGELQVRHRLLKKAPVKVRTNKSSMGKAWAGGSFLTEVHPFRQSKRLTQSPRLGRTWEKRRA